MSKTCGLVEVFREAFRLPAKPTRVRGELPRLHPLACPYDWTWRFPGERIEMYVPVPWKRP